MKKCLSVLLAVLLLCTMLPLGALSVAAETGTYGNLTYQIADDTITITDCESSVSGALTIPDTINGYPVTAIGEQAFSVCVFLTSVTIPDSVTTIGNSAFLSCVSLTSVTIPDSVTTIGVSAFTQCESLVSATIPDSVTIIGNSAFSCCSSLTSVIIGDGVITIGNGVFQTCVSLTSIIVDENNPYFSDIDGVLFNKDKTTLVLCPGGKTGRYIIPSGVTTIGYYAFNGCDSLTSVIIGDGVTTIGNSAFSCCDSLTSVTIPDSVTTIENAAFERCTGLTSVTIGNSVATIGAKTFYQCTSLTAVTIGNSVTTIQWTAFYGCASLTSVTIPKCVTNIQYEAFYKCTALTDVYYGGSKEDREQMSFEEQNDYLLNATWYYGCIKPEDHYSPDVDNSVMDTEDGNGLAYKFELKLNGLKAVQGNKVDFTNATVNYKGETCKVVAMGAVVSNVENKKMELDDVNGTTTIDVPVVYLTDLESDSCQFAVRIINIPETALDRTIYARPYYVIETKDGTVTVYGKISSASCAEYM